MSGRGFTVNKDWDNPVEHAMPAESRVPAEVRLGSVVVRPATVLAPMAGVTDTVFRRFIRHASLFSHAEFGVDAGPASHISESRCGAPSSVVQLQSAIAETQISVGESQTSVAETQIDAAISNAQS